MSRKHRRRPSRVFLHEFITSGALSGQPLPPSLLREGLAMRRAVALDLLALGVEVVSTREDRVPALNLPRLDEFTVSDNSREAALFSLLCDEADQTLVIAPEIDGELQRRVKLAIDANGFPSGVWNCLRLIATASDKWETYRRLQQSGVPTIETCLGSSEDWRAWDCPIVKPRDGAGSQDVRKLTEVEDITLDDRLIVQPFIHGTWLSCTLFFLRNGNHIIFPPAEQQIADDGRFTYLGGVVPARCDVDRVQSLARNAVFALVDEGRSWIDPVGLGPVGVDLVEDERSGNLLVCEINPRFTTSYVAARELSETNLLAGLIQQDVKPPAWKSQRIEFDAAGSIRVCD